MRQVNQAGTGEAADCLPLAQERLIQGLRSLGPYADLLILDLGSGTGTGTLALAARFADADVTAVDTSATMLDRVAHQARARQLTGRVHTLRADLDAG